MSSSIQYFLRMSYDGTDYFGWQSQAQDEIKTIQDELIKAIEQLAKQRPTRCFGLSRTDRGVHARDQVCTFLLNKDLSPRSMLEGLNFFLPKDIKVFHCEKIPLDINLAAYVASKEYAYYFTDADVLHPIVARYVSQIKGPFSLDLLKDALSIFLGEHDFTNFKVRGTITKHCIRKIYSIEVAPIELLPLILPGHSPVYKISFHGNGFLKQMIRLLASSGFMVARGRQSINLIQTALKYPDQFLRVAPVAPARGLVLEKIHLKGYDSARNNEDCEGV